jgi:short-subunit dehydrogenase
MGDRRFSGRVALITGASSGIGAALARELARRGARVILAARRLDRLNQLAADIRAAGGDAEPVCCDVTRDGDVERAVAVAIARFGRLDAVVANAGFGVSGPMATLVVDDYRRQFETNVLGVVRSAMAAAPALSERGGLLVIIGSVTGFVAPPGSSAYAMSKHAVRALAQALHAELAPQGIAVLHVAPGFIDSEIRKVDNQGALHGSAPDPIPAWLRMPAERAARVIVAAMAHRRRECIVTAHGRAIVFLGRHFPRLVAHLLRRAGPYRTQPGDAAQLPG